MLNLSSNFKDGLGKVNTLYVYVKIGDDGDIDSADFVINSSVNVNNVTDGIVERPIFIR